MASYLDQMLEGILNGPSGKYMPQQSPAPSAGIDLIQSLLGPDPQQSPIPPAMGNAPSGMRQTQVVGGQPGPMGQVGQAVGMGQGGGDLLSATGAYGNTQNLRTAGLPGIGGALINAGEMAFDAAREPGARRDLQTETNLAAAKEQSVLNQQQLKAQQMAMARSDALQTQGYNPVESDRIAASSMGDHNFNLKDWKAPDDTADMRNLENRSRWIKTPEGREWATRQGQETADTWLATGQEPSKAGINYNVATDTYLLDENDPSKGAGVIKGSKLDLDQKAELAQFERGVADQIYTTQNAMNQVQKGLDKVGFWTTGVPGYFGRMVPGTPAKELDAVLDTLKANTAFKALYDMRQASPTGGALGNVSNREIQLLYSSWTQLNQAQGKEAVTEALNELMERYQRVNFLLERRHDLEGISGVDQAKMADRYVAQQKTPETAIQFLRDNPGTSGEFKKKWGWLPDG